MLPEIAAEAMHFLSRRDLNETWGVSKWLDSLIAQTCDVYPLRPVLFARLDWCGNEFKLYISTFGWKYASTRQSYASMDEAVRFLGHIFRHSFVERLEVNFSEFYVMYWKESDSALRVSLFFPRYFRCHLF